MDLPQTYENWLEIWQKFKTFCWDSSHPPFPGRSILKAWSLILEIKNQFPTCFNYLNKIKNKTEKQNSVTFASGTNTLNKANKALLCIPHAQNVAVAQKEIQCEKDIICGKWRGIWWEMRKRENNKFGSMCSVTWQ